MKTVLLWNPRVPVLAPVRLSLPDEVASALVRCGVAAAADPADQGALQAGGALAWDSLIEVVVEDGPLREIRRVLMPDAAVSIAASLGIAATVDGTSAGAVAPTLNALTLAASSIVENSGPGTVVGGILDRTDGSTLTLVDDAVGRFAIGGVAVVAGATATDYETATSHSITIRESKEGFADRDTVLTISVVNEHEQPVLGALSLSADEFFVGVPASGSIIGATAGSAITAGELPTGLAINGAARTWVWTGEGTVGSATVDFTEALADSPNSPRVTPIDLTISEADETAPAYNGGAALLGDFADGADITIDYGDWDADSLTIALDSDGDAIEGVGPWSIANGDPAPTFPFNYDQMVGRRLRATIVGTKAGSEATATGHTPARIGLYDGTVDFVFGAGEPNNGTYDLLRGYSQNGIAAWENVNETGVAQTDVYASRIARVEGGLKWIGSPGNDNNRLYRLNLGAPVTGMKMTVRTRTGMAVDAPMGGFIFFANNGNNFVSVGISRNSVQINQRLAGVNTALAPGSVTTINDMDEVEVRKIVSGGNVYLRRYVNGVAINESELLGPIDPSLASSNYIGISNGGFVDSGQGWPQNYVEAFSTSMAQSAQLFPSIVSMVRSPDDPDLARITYGGGYSGAIEDVQRCIVDEFGTVVLDWTTPAAVSGGVLSGQDDVPLGDGQGYTVFWRDPADPSTAAAVDGTAPILRTVQPMLLGINEDPGTYWEAGKIRANLFLQTRPSGSDNKLIYLPNEAPRAPGDGYNASADGLGGTVKMDLDGTVYGNSASLTSYRFSGAWLLPAIGTYELTVPSGTVVTKQTGPAWAEPYNQATGKAVIDFAALNVGANPLNILVTLSPAIEADGILPDLRRQGVEGEFNPEPVASTAAMSSLWRAMACRGTNHFNLPREWTPNALPVLTVDKLWDGYDTGGFSVRSCVAFANAAGQSYWHNSFYQANNAVLDYEAGHIADNLSAGKFCILEVSNEVWNDKTFPRHARDALAAGVRAGLGPFAPFNAPGPCIDAYDLVPGWTGRTTVAFSAGDILCSNVWDGGGANGHQVWECIADAPIDTSIHNSSYFTLRLGSGHCGKVMKRMLGLWTREAGARYRAQFAARGRQSDLKIAVNVAAVLGISGASDILADDPTGMIQLIAGGWYAGQGIGGGGDLGIFDNSGAAGYGETEKSLIYSGGSAAAKTAYFAAAYASIDYLIEWAKTYADAVATLNVSQGLHKDHRYVVAYEGGMHDVHRRWPDMCGAWENRGYSLRDFTLGGDGKTYRCILAHGAGSNPTSSPTYWAEYWDQEETTTFRADPPSRKYYYEIQRDQRMYDLITHFMTRWRDEVGGPFVWYTRAKVRDAANFGSSSEYKAFGILTSEQDTDMSEGPGTNWQYKALVDFQAALSA